VFTCVWQKAARVTAATTQSVSAVTQIQLDRNRIIGERERESYDLFSTYACDWSSVCLTSFREILAIHCHYHDAFTSISLYTQILPHCQLPQNEQHRQ
jgi:hypothetical protein